MRVPPCLRSSCLPSFRVLNIFGSKSKPRGSQVSASKVPAPPPNLQASLVHAEPYADSDDADQKSPEESTLLPAEGIRHNQKVIEDAPSKAHVPLFDSEQLVNKVVPIKPDEIKSEVKEISTRLDEKSDSGSTSANSSSTGGSYEDLNFVDYSIQVLVSLFNNGDNKSLEYQDQQDKNRIQPKESFQDDVIKAFEENGYKGGNDAKATLSERKEQNGVSVVRARTARWVADLCENGTDDTLSNSASYEVINTAEKLSLKKRYEKAPLLYNGRSMPVDRGPVEHCKKEEEQLQKEKTLSDAIETAKQDWSKYLNFKNYYSKEPSTEKTKTKKAAETRARHEQIFELKEQYLLSKEEAENLAKNLGYPNDYVENILNPTRLSNSNKAHQKGLADAKSMQDNFFRIFFGMETTHAS